MARNFVVTTYFKSYLIHSDIPGLFDMFFTQNILRTTNRTKVDHDVCVYVTEMTIYDQNR